MFVFPPTVRKTVLAEIDMHNSNFAGPPRRANGVLFPRYGIVALSLFRRDADLALLRGEGRSFLRSYEFPRHQTGECIYGLGNRLERFENRQEPHTRHKRLGSRASI